MPPAWIPRSHWGDQTPSWQAPEAWTPHSLPYSLLKWSWVCSSPSEPEFVLFHFLTFLRQFPFFPFLSKPTAINKATRLSAKATQICVHRFHSYDHNKPTDMINLSQSKLFITISGDNWKIYVRLIFEATEIHWSWSSSYGTRLHAHCLSNRTLNSK